MTGPSSGDRPPDSTDAEIEVQSSATPPAGSVDDGPNRLASAPDPANAAGDERGRSSSEQRDQVGEQRDQAGGRRDLVGHRRDQAGQQRDEAGDQRDQAGERRDTAGDERDHAAGRRDEAAERRDEQSVRRDQVGMQRDRAGEQRDIAAKRRDDAAERRDDAAERSHDRIGEPITAALVERFALSRLAAASDRTHARKDRLAAAEARDAAGADRDTALADRGAGANERSEAELDRETALADRGASAVELESSSLDDLTGAYLRGAGFVELEREMARARREGRSLVLAFVDVDGLKATNDSRGHAAGDRVLRSVVDALRAKLRSHDLIIRFGGDEFLCAVSGLSQHDAATRLALVNLALASSPEHGSVTVGLAELGTGDTPRDLVARADAALYEERLRQRPRGHRSADRR